MKALEGLFSHRLPGGATIIVIPPGSGEDLGGEIDNAIGTPFSWRDGIAPDGRGDDDIPLDAPSDCSSFIANLIAHLTGDKVKLPAFTDDMLNETEPVAPGQQQPMDLALMQYPGQGAVDYGHVGMMLDDDTILDQSTSDEGLTGRPGIDIRPVDHPFNQGGGKLIFRRIPDLERFLGPR